MFIDIEVPVSEAWVGCSSADPTDEISLMSFYVRDKDISHKFAYRNVRSVKECLQIEASYHSLMENLERVRIVGISPMVLSDGEGRDPSRVPAKFTAAPGTLHWTFVRLVTSKGCKSYFEGDCLPENYWGGTNPE